MSVPERFFRMPGTGGVYFADNPRSMTPIKDLNVLELVEAAKGCFPGRCIQDVRVGVGSKGVVFLSEINE